MELPLGNSFPVTDAIAKLSVSRKLITMATKIFESNFLTSVCAFDLVLHNFHGKWFIREQYTANLNIPIKFFCFALLETYNVFEKINYMLCLLMCFVDCLKMFYV